MVLKNTWVTGEDYTADDQNDAATQINTNTAAISGKADIAAIPDALTDLDTTVTGSQLNALKTKVDGVASGATANSPDVTLLARANHTGTQASSTISDFSTAADARIAAARGVSVQAFDGDLTAIAGLTATTDNVIQSVSGAWASRTPAQLKSTLALAKGDVGLGNVTNNAQYFLGGTDVAVADGGTGASDAATARSNLGLVIGTNVLAYVAPATPGYILGTSDGTTWTAQPLTRVTSITSSATPSINVDTTDQFNITALAANITSVTVTGTPRDGQKLMVRINGAASQTIAWGDSFQSSGIATLFSPTVAGKTHHCGFVYDSVVTKWVLLACDMTGY